jgi:hypothetical protein
MKEKSAEPNKSTEEKNQQGRFLAAEQNFPSDRNERNCAQTDTPGYSGIADKHATSEHENQIVSQ